MFHSSLRPAYAFRARCPARAGILAAASLLTLSFCGCAQAQNGFPSFRNLVKKVAPSVVNISVTEEQSAESPDDGQDQVPGRHRPGKNRVLGAGSGFIIDPSGYIVTNDHVVGGASRITVSLADGTQLPARVVGIDELTDIAVIKVAARHALPAVNWGDSRQVEVGDWILVAGNPFGLGSSVTAGIISARGRDIMSGPFDDFLQLDAPINPGNSGGPTFDMTGEVVGVTTAIISPTGGSVGIGFAIPSELAEGIVTELEQRGHIDRGWLGIGVSDAEADAAAPGVVVTGVEPSGPAARAGLRSKDRILTVDGAPVDTALGLIRKIAGIHPGRSARLNVVRRGRPMVATVVVGLRPMTQAE